MTDEAKADAPKRFDCPSCGADSWLDPTTLKVTHAQPTCVAWEKAQREAAAVLRLGKLPEPAPTPFEVHFECPECRAPCLLKPREKPISVQHAIPSCAAWEKIEGKKDDVERFLIKAGVHIHVPDVREVDDATR
jgi:hypothetical protein